MSGEKLRTTEVDGVPVLWMPGEGKLRASLLFRAGVADETLPTRGWLRLLTDLAVRGRTSVSGRAGLLHTSFEVEGGPDEVVALLGSLCQWLVAPDLSGLGPAVDAPHDESAAQDPREVVSSHLYWRYGARGPGVVGASEYGYRTATAEGLGELAGRAFAQGNAALALSGPPPAGLKLPLRPGPRQPPVPAHPVQQPLPGGFGDRQNAIGLSGIMASSPAAEALVRALKRDLQQSLGHGPDDKAWASYELVDGDHVMVTAGMEVSPEVLPVLLRESTAVVRRLRDHGPDPKDLRDDLAARIQKYSSQPAGQWLPLEGARHLLLGRPVSASVEALAAETDAVTVEAVQREALGLWKNLLVSVDPGVVAEPELTWLNTPPSASGRTLTGISFQPTTSPVTKAALTVGPTALRLEREDGEITVWYDELAGVLAYPDGGRRLFRLDGYPVRIEPTLWRDGRQAIAIIDSSVPPWLRIPMPERSPEEIPKDTVTRIDRLRYWTNRPVVFAPLLIVVLMAVILFALQEETGKWGVWLIPILLGSGVVGYLRHRRQRS